MMELFKRKEMKEMEIAKKAEEKLVELKKKNDKKELTWKVVCVTAGLIVGTVAGILIGKNMTDVPVQMIDLTTPAE